LPGTFGLFHLAAGTGDRQEGSKCLSVLINHCNENPLLNLGDEICSLSNEHDKATPLMFATLSNNEINFKLILKAVRMSKSTKNSQDKLVNMQDCMGNTVCHFAIANKQINLLKISD